ncbi:tRNA1(Val) (adenine(37)-N6)-methyltransferase [Capnocytophaga sp. G2]|uniref:tRNA1(Val) (adenine(37)-N6)-methyltransferase n=1 Tax=Capnocytophaga sp. G2 TaxID=3110695 RepID=UPI002B47F26C|nr:methyltransferase [Capnocytophaga sp. G2]MEB3004454.1 methyltransferase [Capnocytophaga sp. G2]
MFQFRQFSVKQEYSAMKIGTDSVLLGAWAASNNPQRILDIGAGTGILSLMMAQRFPTAYIHAIEITPEATQECRENISLSPWKDRISVYQEDIRIFSKVDKHKYDLIISNPPFFTEKVLSPNFQRSLSRSNLELPFEELLYCVSQLLSPIGTFAVIIPYKEESVFKQLAQKDNLYPSDILHVKGNINTPIKRSLLLFSFEQKINPLIKVLTIEKERHLYTKEYQELTKNFYLKF